MKDTDGFLPIPVATKYEMNERGVIRNIKTGKVIKWGYRGTSKQASLRDEHGKTICVTFPNLMWMMFGKRVTHTGALPVLATKGYRQLYFNSCRECAFALAKSMNYSPSTLYNNMSMRKRQIGDWTFKYME